MPEHLKSGSTEFNIEGNPISKFIDLALEVKPHQVTLVPDAENANINAGWTPLRISLFCLRLLMSLNQMALEPQFLIQF